MYIDNVPSTVGGCKEDKHCATVKTQAESITEQVNVTPTVITPGPVVVKIPVVIAETNITIPVEATITLDKNAIEIKRIKKNVFLTQSRIIPFSQGNHDCTGVLFISGFIRKNIEYATETCSSGKSGNVCGDIRHCTVQVPFNFSTRVTFLRTPIFNENTTPSELEFFTDKLEGCDECTDPVIGRNSCDQSFFFTEFFNEKPYVELVRADITEVDIHTNPNSCCQEATEQTFSQLTEKVIVNLTLKVLQKQQVKLGAI
ncbi:hypothetical protein LGK97_08125 [Clostridium sp. CS001]|nr:hypothetical protein [Clostridium sp. CS001]MCB2289730.1 hypothetical protein [Clostridium sp. CS001]